jgi:hypothetical protein
MNLTNNFSNTWNNLIKDSVPKLITPPILNGFESKLKQINKNDAKLFKENIKNTIIKDDNDNNIIQNDLLKKKQFNIRTPPNFLY